MKLHLYPSLTTLITFENSIPAIIKTTRFVLKITIKLNIFRTQNKSY